MVHVDGSGKMPENNNRKQVKKSAGEQSSNKSVFNNASSYKVKDQDNFFKIAKKYGMSVYDLAIANGWEYDSKTKTVRDSKGKVVNLTVGMNISLAKKASQAKSEVSPKSNNPTSHTVKQGESPFLIAEKYNISIRQLAAANDWDVKLTSKNGKEHLEVFSNNKQVVLAKGQDLKIPKSVVKDVGTITNLSQMMKVSGMSEGQREVFVKFEGNPDKNFKPYTEAKKDAKGTWTIGYGYTKGVKKGDKWSLQQCYQQLAKDYLQIREDIRVELGNEIFNKMPESLKEGLIDLVFNKGFSAVDIPSFQKAIKNDDMKSAFKQLIYTKSMVDDKEMNGLYKRSLGRLAHTYSGLSIEDKAEVKPFIDEFYKDCKSRVSKVELDNWWQPEKVGESTSKDSEKVLAGTKSQYIVQEDDKSLYSIAKKLGVSFQQLSILNRHLAPNFIIKAGDKININAQLVVDVPTKNLPSDIKLSEEIVNIKNMDLDSAERLSKTNELIDAYAKKYNLSEEAVRLFKAEAKKEYDAWFWVDTDKMTAMTDVLDASDATGLYKAIDGAIDESDEARLFTKEVLVSKINKDNIAELIDLSGGSKKFIKMMKKVGDFAILKHSLMSLTEGATEQQNLLTQYNKAVKEEDYSEIQRVFDNVLATSAKDISDNLETTLADDDDLNAILYKYQINKVNSDNIISVLKENDIIAGICEADNERSLCKEEIKKLFDVLDKNYDLDDNARESFLQVFEAEFRDRSVFNPTTWWIGTSKVSAAFNKLLEGDLKQKNMRQAIAKSLGWTESDMKPVFKTNGKVEPIYETFEPTGTGVLSGRKILINSGHGGYNPNTKEFDIGAEGIKSLGVTEWMMNRFMSKKVIDRLRELGAEIVFTAGHFETVSYQGYESDLLVSIHSDSREKGSSVGPKIIAHPNDKEDNKLALNILENYVQSDGVTNLKKLDFAKKDGTWYKFNKQFLSDEKPDSMQANAIFGSKQVLRKSDKESLDEPAVLVEFCDINNEKDLRNIVLGKYGDEIADAIVKGIVSYWS